MTTRRWLGLIAVGLIAACGMALLIRVPGYMDAEYYYATAAEVAGGNGFVEPFLWNYLDDPSGIPHPSHLYWMPLTSLLAAGGIVLFGAGFRAAQLPFVLLTAGLPPLTAWIALRLGSSARQAFIAGLFAAFSGFYLPFLVTTDAFSAFAWLGTLAFVAGATASRGGRRILWGAAGALVGAAHLARADGLLLIVPLVVLAGLVPRRRFVALLLLAVGYAVVMGPWCARNLALTGSLLAPYGTRTLWLTSYDELFTFPSSLLGFNTWAAQGLGAILASWARASLTNLQSLVVVTGAVVLGPFMLIGAWRRQHEPLVAAGMAYLGLLFCVMTLVFPFSGARGGFFHSSAAVLPILWALTPIGLDAALAKASAWRGWDPARAGRLFAPMLVACAAGISVWVAWDRAAAGWPDAPRWEQAASDQAAVTKALLALDPLPGVVAVNDPPGFYLASKLPCVVIPYGDVVTLRRVADRYGVGWVVLDANHPQPLSALYESPESIGWLSLKRELVDAKGRPLYLLQVIPSTGVPPS
jgi:4-amino-4-deoxy-L-arabinose transferase-like glycosyltransferase